MFLNFRYKYIPQVDERDCGLAALAMVLIKYKTSTSIAHLRELAKTNIEGTTALGIVKAASHFNFETKAIQADMSLFQLKDIPYPFIVHVVKDGDLLHYYTVFKASANYLIVGDPDPSCGIKRISKCDFANEWDGVAIFMAPFPQYQPVQEKKESILSLLPLIFRQKLMIIQIMVASFLTTMISIIGSYYFQGLIDTYIPGGMKQPLVVISIGLVVAYIFQGFFDFAQQYMLTVISQRLSIDIILGYIKHIFELPMSFFYTRRTGEITSRFNDANQIINALASTIVSLFLNVLIITTVGIILAIQNMNLFLLTLVSIPIYTIIILSFIKSFNNLNKKTMQDNAMLSSSIIEDINGMETIKAINSEYKAYAKVDSDFVKFLKHSFEYAKVSLEQEELKKVFQLGLNVCILWYGTILVINGKITLGQLITYNALLSYFTNPIETIISLQTKIQSAKVAHNRLNEVYLVSSENSDEDSDTQILPKKIEPIELRHIFFRYGFGSYVLNDVNLRINSGEKITLVGASGSGKSTLAKSLVRFSDIDKGDILYGDTNIKFISRKSLRQNIVYIPQNPVIFTGSIKKNVQIGNSNADINDIINALKTAEIYDDISKMPMGLNTELSDDGIMSGGQRQRIALARGLLADSPVLILDESTSNLDVITEHKIVENLMKYKDKTIIFVAHRLSIAKMTNRILVMSAGKIVQSGTHDELILEKNGNYASYFK